MTKAKGLDAIDFPRYDAYIPHPRVVVDTGEFTYTKQSPKDECDINNILAQYKRTGIINHISAKQAQYIDLPDENDFQASLNTVKAAQEAFASLPSKVRDRFGNDPAKFLNALYDPARRAEFEELGVIRAAKPVDEVLKTKSPASAALGD